MAHEPEVRGQVGNRSFLRRQKVPTLLAVGSCSSGRQHWEKTCFCCLCCLVRGASRGSRSRLCRRCPSSCVRVYACQCVTHAPDASSKWIKEPVNAPTCTQSPCWPSFPRPQREEQPGGCVHPNSLPFWSRLCRRPPITEGGPAGGDAPSAGAQARAPTLSSPLTWRSCSDPDSSTQLRV